MRKIYRQTITARHRGHGSYEFRSTTAHGYDEGVVEDTDVSSLTPRALEVWVGGEAHRKRTDELERALHVHQRKERHTLVRKYRFLPCEERI